MLIEGRHFRREWSSATDIGRKAAARNLADIAAMGARPTALLVAFAGPADLEVSWVLDLVTGIARECAAAGASVAGGDTSGADTVMLAVTALGDLADREPVTRAGARPGNVVAVAGTLGAAAAGLALLTAGWRPRSADQAEPTVPSEAASPSDASPSEAACPSEAAVPRPQVPPASRRLPAMRPTRPRLPGWSWLTAVPRLPTGPDRRPRRSVRPR